MTTRKATHADIIATENVPGFRVTVFRNSKVIATSFFKVAGGWDDWKAKSDAAYRDAKNYCAAFGVC